MQIHNKQRYNFAMSSFVRMHGYSIIHNIDVKQFCLEWSNWEVNAPLQGLDEVDHTCIMSTRTGGEDDHSSCWKTAQQ